MENQLELLKLVLPDILVEHFNLISSKTEGETLHLYFEEQNKPPVEHVGKNGVIDHLKTDDIDQSFLFA